MHHKFAVIDNKKVITGSFNWSPSAAHTNDETLLVIESPKLAAHFTQEMDRMWRGAELGVTARMQRKLDRQARKCGSGIERGWEWLEFWLYPLRDKQTYSNRDILSKLKTKPTKANYTLKEPRGINCSKCKQSKLTITINQETKCPELIKKETIRKSHKAEKRLPAEMRTLIIP